MKRVAFAGSQNLDLKEYAQAIFDEIAVLPEGTHVLLRQGRTTGYGPFEQFVAEVCRRLNIDVDPYLPEEGQGRAAVWERDILMATQSDEVVAFFPPDEIMVGGTGHVVEKAIDVDRRVNCYIMSNGRKTWVAGNEPAIETVSAR